MLSAELLPHAFINLLFLLIIFLLNIRNGLVTALSLPYLWFIYAAMKQTETCEVVTVKHEYQQPRTVEPVHNEYPPQDSVKSKANHRAKCQNLDLYRISRGDQIAFERFFNAYQPRLMAFLLTNRITLDDAYEIVNQVMYEIWQHSRRFDHRSKLTTWIYGITRHKLIDKIRQISRQDGLLDHYTNMQGQLDYPDTSAEEHVEHEEDTFLVTTALKQLNTEQRHLIYFTYYLELGTAEVAHILGCPRGTVKSRLYKAKQALKAILSRNLAHV